MFDTVIFDLDGTLSDNSEGIIKSIGYALENMHIQVPETRILKRFIGPPLMVSLSRYCNMNDMDARHAVELYRDRYDKTGYLENCLYPGIRALLTELKHSGSYLAVATGKPKDITLKILDHFGILALFDEVKGTVPDAVSGSKSDMIKAIAARHPGKAVMVGDTVEDIRSAHEAGITGLFVGYGFGETVCGMDEPDLKAEKVEDLSKLLLGYVPEKRGVFISLEGLDGCGKTTVSNHLEIMMKQYGYPVLHTREPGGCPISESIRQLLLSPENSEMTATTEALLYAASRYQHVTDVILPAVRRGDAVICDRYVDSSLAYQGEGRQLGLPAIRAYNEQSMKMKMPDITVYLRLDAETSLNRRLSESTPDRIEREKREFFERTQQGFDRLAQEEPERYLVIDASQPLKYVLAELAERLPVYLKRGGFWA